MSLEWCLSVALAVAIDAGCAGVEVKPRPGDCPANAVAAMKERELPLDRHIGFDVTLDIRHPEPPPFWAVSRAGELVGRLETPATGLPVGTLLHGMLWPGDPSERLAWVRYTEAEIPGGGKVPICFETAWIGWHDGSTPSAPVIDTNYVGQFVTRWRDPVPPQFH